MIIIIKSTVKIILVGYVKSNVDIGTYLCLQKIVLIKENLLILWNYVVVIQEYLVVQKTIHFKISYNNTASRKLQ